MDRIGGIDVVRGLAVLGMFAAHIGFDGDEGISGWLWLTDGRSAATFALLAGLSVALFTGRDQPPAPGAEARRARARVLSRAGVLFVIGILLQALNTPIAVILPSYAVTFALLSLAVTLRASTCALLAAVAAVIGPVISLSVDLAAGGIPAWVGSPANPVGKNVADLVLVGYYPAVVWVAYMLLGLAVGRLRLRDHRVQGGLAIGGAIMALTGYGASRLLVPVVADSPSELVRGLVTAAPHDDTTFELVGNAGVTLMLLAAALAVTTWKATARAAGIVLYPLAATGAMALTAYTVHIVAIRMLGDDVVWHATSNAVLAWFVAVTLVATTLWRLTVGRGPLELLMRAVTPSPLRRDQDVASRPAAG